MKKYTLETSVGLFCLLGLLCVAYLTVKLGKMEILGGDVYRINRWHESYIMAVCCVASEQHAPLLDIRSAFLMRRDCFSLLCEDGIHPNEKGHALISSVLAERLPALLCGNREPAPVLPG